MSKTVTTRYFALAIDYDHGTVSAQDIEEALEQALADRAIESVVAVGVGRRLHDDLIGTGVTRRDADVIIPGDG